MGNIEIISSLQTLKTAQIEGMYDLEEVQFRGVWLYIIFAENKNYKTKRENINTNIAAT